MPYGTLETLTTELAKEVIKDWRRPAAVLLRLAIPFGLSAVIRVTAITLLPDVHQRNDLDIRTPKVLSPSTGLEAGSP